MRCRIGCRIAALFRGIRTPKRLKMIRNRAKSIRKLLNIVWFSYRNADKAAASAPCILAILTHLRVRVKICILTHPQVLIRKRQHMDKPGKTGKKQGKSICRQGISTPSTTALKAANTLLLHRQIDTF